MAVRSQRVDVAIPYKVKRAVQRIIITLKQELARGSDPCSGLHLEKQTSAVCVLKIDFKNYVLYWLILVSNHLGI